MVLPGSIVDRLYADLQLLRQLLEKDASLRIAVEEQYRKGMLLTAASLFEYRITESILNFMAETSSDDELTIQFVKNKAVARQYHTYFDWNAQNANQFFALFGADFRRYMEKEIQDTQGLADCVRAFLEVGRERNRLVHEDYGTAPLEKTAEEIFVLHQQALRFVDLLPKKFRAYVNRSHQEPDAPGDK
jgi:hypothetical protein